MDERRNPKSPKFSLKLAECYDWTWVVLWGDYTRHWMQDYCSFCLFSSAIPLLKESAASLLQQFGIPPFELFHSTCEQCFILLSKERAILNNLVIEYICSPALGSGQTSLAPALQLGEAEEKSWLASEWQHTSAHKCDGKPPPCPNTTLSCSWITALHPGF